MKRSYSGDKKQEQIFMLPLCTFYGSITSRRLSIFQFSCLIHLYHRVRSNGMVARTSLRNYSDKIPAARRRKVNADRNMQRALRWTAILAPKKRDLAYSV